jgi:metal-responsive CopG/Arc/MetJ family transcriptional regulator
MARAIQVSIDPQLLRRVDADPEAKHKGRSAFIRAAIESYLRAKEERAFAEGLRKAYVGKAEALEEEFRSLMDAQVWLEDD